VLTGEVREIFRSPNLIVDQYREQSVLLIAGNYANRNLSIIRLGTSNTAPAIADTAITGAVGIAISSNTFTTPYSNVRAVTFTAILDADEGNDVAFVEAGLFFANGLMGARLVFPIMTKSANFIWTLNWTLSVTAGS